MRIGARVDFAPLATGRQPHGPRGTVEGEHPLHVGYLVKFDGDAGQSLVAERDLRLVTEPREFRDSGRAYDACQADETLTPGVVLDCLSDRVVGLAWTWPVAVSEECGALHTPAVHGNLRTLMQQANWCDEHVRAAVALCRARGIPVNDKFLEVL